MSLGTICLHTSYTSHQTGGMVGIEKGNILVHCFNIQYIAGQSHFKSLLIKFSRSMNDHERICDLGPWRRADVLCAADIR